MAALSGDVDIPKIGRLPKVAVIGGVAAVIGLVVWEKHKQNQGSSASPAASGTADPYPPDGSVGNTADPNSTDPSTGQTYGDEAAGYSAAAGGLGDLYGTGASLGAGVGYTGQTGDAFPWDGTYGNPNDPYSMDPSSGITYGNEGNTGTTSGTPAGPPFSTNAQWSQYVLNYFSQQQASDLAGRTDAIGLYINGQTVTPQQKQYVDDAIAIGGAPPVAGASGFPPSIRTSGSTTTTGTATVPNVMGMTGSAAATAIRAVGLVPGPQASKPGTVYSQTPGAGKKVQQGTTVDIGVRVSGTTGGGNPPSADIVTVPRVDGLKVGPAHNDIVRAGLVVANRPNSNWVVHSTSPAGGARVAKGSKVTINAAA